MYGPAVTDLLTENELSSLGVLKNVFKVEKQVMKSNLNKICVNSAIRIFIPFRINDKLFRFTGPLYRAKMYNSKCFRDLNDFIHNFDLVNDVPVIKKVEREELIEMFGNTTMRIVNVTRKEHLILAESNYNRRRWMSVINPEYWILPLPVLNEGPIYVQSNPMTDSGITKYLQHIGAKGLVYVDKEILTNHVLVSVMSKTDNFHSGDTQVDLLKLSKAEILEYASGCRFLERWSDDQVYVKYRSRYAEAIKVLNQIGITKFGTSSICDILVRVMFESNVMMDLRIKNVRLELLNQESKDFLMKKQLSIREGNDALRTLLTLYYLSSTRCLSSIRAQSVRELRIISTTLTAEIEMTATTKFIKGRINEIFEKKGYLIIGALPGSGKSTFVKNLCEVLGDRSNSVRIIDSDDFQFFEESGQEYIYHDELSKILGRRIGIGELHASDWSRLYREAKMFVEAREEDYVEYIKSRVSNEIMTVIMVHGYELNWLIRGFFPTKDAPSFQVTLPDVNYRTRVLCESAAVVEDRRYQLFRSYSMSGYSMDPGALLLMFRNQFAGDGFVQL